MKVLALSLCLAIAGPARAQTEAVPMDEAVSAVPILAGLIWEFGQQYSGGPFCLGGVSIAQVRQDVQAEAARRGWPALPTPQQVITLMAARRPCPFSPYREEVRAAVETDLYGAWVTPDKSERLARPPQAREHPGIPPLRCEAVGFFEDGESRTIEMRGRVDCPFKNAGTFEVARSLPRTTTWRMSPPGTLTLTRSDVPGHVEEWETFVVDVPFSMQDFRFEKGDLVSYLRNFTGNTSGVASRFRHLRRLPGQ